MYNNIFHNPNDFWLHDPAGDPGDDMQKGCVSALMVGASILIGLLICALLGSCSPKVIENTVVRKDTVLVNHTARDSIYVHDSIYTHEMTRGDTVLIETTRWRDRWRERILHDSVYVSKCDTVVRTIAGEPQCTLTGWQWFQIWAGRLALLAVAVIVVIILVKNKIVS